jgi:hypothetical protein
MGSPKSLIVLTVAVGTIAAVATTAVIATRQAGNNVLKGEAAFGDWRTDAPGVRRLLTAQDLPAPSLTPSAANSANVVPMPAGAMPQVPAGFKVEMIVSGVKNPRVVRVAPNGDLFVADMKSHAVRTYRLAPDSGKVVASETFADGLFQPYGIAFYPLGANPQWVYIANSDGLVRVPYANGDLKRDPSRNASSNAFRFYITRAGTWRWRRMVSASFTRSDRVPTSHSTCFRRRTMDPSISGKLTIRWARRGTPKSAAPTCCRSIRTGRTKRLSRPASATVRG